MAIRTEFDLRLPNSPGALSAVCSLLSQERVTILAMSLESTGRLRLVVDNRVRAGAALREQHHQVSERDVILVSVPHAPGGFAPIASLVAKAGINIEYAYGSAAEQGASSSIVLGVDDAQRAAAVAGV